MTEQPERIEVVIKHNKYARYEACRVCGRDRQLAIGPCLFEDGTWRMVCEECGREHAPGLSAMLASEGGRQAYWAARSQDARKRERESGAADLADLEARLHSLQKQMAGTQAQIDALRNGTGDSS